MSYACGKLPECMYFFLLRLQSGECFCSFGHIADQSFDKARIELFKLSEMFFVKQQCPQLSGGKRTTRIDFHSRIGHQAAYTTGLFIIGESKIINEATVNIHVKGDPSLEDDKHDVRFIACFFNL